MNSFNHNDDDIFDESSYLSTNDDDIIESEKDRKINNIFDDLFGDATNSKKSKKIDPNKLIPNLVGVFYKSVTAWVESDYDEFFRRAVFTFNDHLIQGKAKPFPYYEKYYANQNSLAKRRVVGLFLQQLLEDPQELVTSARAVNFPITEQVIATYFRSYHNINQFCILEEFAQYKALAEYLDLPFSDLIMMEAPDRGSVYGPQPYSHFVQTSFGIAVTEEYGNILQRCIKEALNEFVKIKEKEDIQETEEV